MAERRYEVVSRYRWGVWDHFVWDRERDVDLFEGLGLSADEAERRARRLRGDAEEGCRVKGWFCERDLRDARMEYGEGGRFWVRVPVSTDEALAALEALGRGVTPGYVVRSEVSIVEREG